MKEVSGDLLTIRRGMQECFRKYPEVYSDELVEDEAEEDALSVDGNGQPPPVGEEQPTAARKANLEEEAAAPEKEAAGEKNRSVPAAAKPVTSEAARSKGESSQTLDEDKAEQKSVVAVTENA